MSDTFYDSLGSTIRKRRISAGLTQAALAERTGLLRTTVTNIERGSQAVMVHQLAAIAGALNSSIEALVPETQGGPAQLLEPVPKQIMELFDRLQPSSPRRRS